MYFSIYYGSSEFIPRWKKALREHALWLNRQIVFSEPSEKGRTVLCTSYMISGQQLHKSQDEDVATEPLIRKFGLFIDKQSDEGPDDLFENQGSNRIKVYFDSKSFSCRAYVPLATPEQLFYYTDEGQTILSNDLRFLRRLSSKQIDSRAVFSLLQFAAVPAPFSFYVDIKRVPGGHVCVMEPGTPAKFKRYYHNNSRHDVKDPVESVSSALGGLLSNTDKSSLLYFSGGVDSSLLATLLLETGCKDIKLANLSFGPDDTEAKHAVEIADYLGLECTQTQFHLDNIPNMLTLIGKDYTYPFGDVSTIPTNMLVHDSMALFDNIDIFYDGTGADGVFGLGVIYNNWNRVYSVPRVIGRMVAFLYAHSKWHKRSRLSKIGRIISRSVQMPQLHAAIMTINSLNGIAYTIPDNDRADIFHAINDNILTMFSDSPSPDKASMLDLMHVCAGEYATKTHGPLCSHDMDVAYPFLDPSMIRLGNSMSWEQKCPAGEPKGVLKTMLAKKIPEQMVYRRKSGFIPPVGEIFREDSMQEVMRDCVLSSTNPLVEYFDTNTTLKLVEKARSDTMCITVYNYLWVLIFTSVWLSQISERDQSSL